MKLFCLLAVTSSVAAAFAPPLAHTKSVRRTAPSHGQLSVTMFDDDETTEYVTATTSTSKPTKVMSQAIPFLACPTALADSSLAGNAGFDPMGFAKSKDDLWAYREAEIKHARLAMLAAAGWPVSELLDRPIAQALGLPVMLDAEDRVPSVLNGGLDSVSPVWWGACLGMTAAIDMYGTALARKADPTYFPGNLGFDPLSFYPSDKLGQERMQQAEIKHGRLAMVAATGFAVQEYATKLGVVDETPVFFYPAGAML